MRITAIGHASYLFETAYGAVLSDPVFFDPFEGGANSMYPARTVDVSSIPRLSCIVLTHRHFDHFDVRTLSELDRSAMVFYPHGDMLIEHALKRLGFQRRRGVRPWSVARLRGMTLTTTPSNVEWPEMGLAISDGATTVWSLVDTVVDANIIEMARSILGNVDCLLAPYSPLVQYELRDPTRAKDVDWGAYETLLWTVAQVNPRVVVPAAGGLRFFVARWQNAFGFPISPHRFISDVARSVPLVDGQLLDPGDVLEFDGGGCKVERQRAPFAQLVEYQSRIHQLPTDPAVGVSAFCDTNPLGSPIDKLTDFAWRYVEKCLVGDLTHPTNIDIVDDYRRWQVLWRLDVHFPLPSGSEGERVVLSRWVDFGCDELRLECDGTGDVAVWTVVAASGIFDLMHGRCSSYAYLFTDRTRHTMRVYSVSPDGLARPGVPLREPLFAALTGPRDPDDVYVAAELQRWTTHEGFD